MSDDQVGAILTAGPSDWQIIQQDGRGLGQIHLEGRWVCDEPGTVEARLVREDTGAPVTAALDWQPAETFPDGHWHVTLADIPAGGLYRLETHFKADSNPATEWALRGDLRHFLGVGDLWVIAGQSNSAGYGRGPYGDPPELGVHVFRNSEQWALATQPLNESTDTAHPVNREGGNPGHSPYLHFGRLLQNTLGHPIGLVQTSLGGSPLSMWLPDASGDATLFDNMVHCVRQVGGRVRGILWYQGESDCGGDRAAATYADRFIQAVGAWRQAFGIPGLPVITVQLNRFYGPFNDGDHRRWTQVRDAQRQVPHRLAGIAVVPTFDLTLTDGIHTSPAGNRVLADRMAAAALGAVCGRPVAHQAPDVQSATLIDHGATVQLAFAHVTSRMECIAPAADAFRIEDDSGELPITAVAYPQDATVHLALGRPLVGHGVVHGAWGANPAAVPMDMVRVMPMLGFYGVAVRVKSLRKTS